MIELELAGKVLEPVGFMTGEFEPAGEELESDAIDPEIWPSYLFR